MSDENDNIPRGIWPDKEEFPSEKWPPAGQKHPDHQNEDRIFLAILLIFAVAAIITTLRFFTTL